MGLDNATVKEFANLINPFDKTSGEATVYGRVVGFNEVGGRPIVQLDGSSQRIPIRTTVKVKGPKGNPGDQDYYDGDRVLVRIKNHEALIVSNISTQMTTAEGAEDAAKQYVSDNGFIYAEKITGEQGDFYTLSADKFTATEITGALGHFITVNADRIITDAINAQIANIDTIKASDVVAGEGDFAYLNVDNVLDAKMANLDIANINKANIGSLLAEIGLISSATIVEGHVTGYLDSVEVNANKITAGTLLVDRLYIKDENNKWKMQTVDGQGQTVYVEAADRINERTITADKLVAHSITTDELNATNITANNSSFMESLTNSLTTNYLFATQANVQDLVAHSVDAELAELDILNINEELKTQNIHLGEIVFDQPSKPSIASDYTDYLLGIERETKTISAYDSTALYSEGDYITHYYSKDNILNYPYAHTTRTYNGITYTDNGDGTITANGTATEDSAFNISAITVKNNILSKIGVGSCILNGCPSNGSSSSYSLRLGYGDSESYKGTICLDTGTGSTGSVTEDILSYNAQIQIIIKSGVTVDNLTFKPKIRLATNQDATWYPFVKGVYKCIESITTAELWDEDKWYYLRDAINGDQYEFDHVRYTNKMKADEIHLGKVFFDQSNKPSANENSSFFLNIDAYDDDGEVHYGTFPLKIGLGGTGATTAANARTNLAVPNMYMGDSYPHLKPANGTDNWIMVGSTTTYGLLPGASGSSGSGHCYLGTSSWYWKCLYVDIINGVTVGSSPKFTDTNTWPPVSHGSTIINMTIYGQSLGIAFNVNHYVDGVNGHHVANNSVIYIVGGVSGQTNWYVGYVAGTTLTAGSCRINWFRYT